MIQLIEAPPRSGKSYYAVNYLMQFVKYDALYHEYVLNSNVLIISNIEGLKIKHWNLDQCLKDKTLEQFFSIKNFEAIMEKTNKNHVIMLIDECHDYFPAGYKSAEIYSFFAFHGHIGLDIFLMTQGIDSMTRMFNPLLEFIVKVTPRSKSMPKTFSYSYYSKGGQFLYSKPLMKKPLVFGAYKSFRKDEQNKPKNALLHWAVISIVLVVGTVFAFKYSIAKVKDHGKNKVAVAQTKPPVVPAIPAAPASAIPLQKQISSARPLPSPLPAPIAPPSEFKPSVAMTETLPRVIGLVGDVNGKNTKYLLSTGQITTCKRSLNIGDIYIR